MQVFKCAMRIIRGNIVFPLIYIIGLSFMGLFMTVSFSFGNPGGDFERPTYDFAVIDRDQSELSAAVEDRLHAEGNAIAIEDDTRQIQDAVAKGQVDYLLIIPEGFEDAFVEAARDGEESPVMETVFSYYSMEGEFVDQGVNGFLGMVRTLLVAKPDASIAQAVEEASAFADERADVSVVESSASVSEADRFVFYLQWSTYTLFAGITVCVGLLVTTLGRVDVRRRNLSSPLSFVAYNVQLAAACAVVTLVAWAWTFCLGLVVFSEAAAQIGAVGLVLCALSMLAFCLVPLAFGLLLGQLGASSIVCNAAGNIVGMVISFFGGAWISLDLLSPEVATLAHGLPGYWYATACSIAAHASNAASFQAVFEHIGVLLLFALALACVSLVAGRKRLQTSEAGGNRAAEVTTTA